MTPTNLATIEAALAHPSVDEDAAVSAIEALAALRRRDWAVCVLWAYDEQRGGMATRWEPFTSQRQSGECCPNNGLRYSGKNREEAWLHAARDVFRDLRSEARAALGEEP